VAGMRTYRRAAYTVYCRHKLLTVGIISDNSVVCIATRRHMVDGAGIL